ncbi:hypothetical protein PZ895_04415 [Mesorhizobium sp. YIM 152430]|uniref:hypothetical protein n=1 Tax=Mesorhizobium sp. YIM 152430 TaxID=3031761 RepID=UPI0023DA1DEF|nr:hypothetical protein [Mesorhizobium sp. YIM 152430]MDF1599024.1 hypothetical protein [Mesorhizobium sp. YIM 152430]
MRDKPAIVLAAAKGEASPAADIFRTGIVGRYDRNPENRPPPLTSAARDGRPMDDRVEGSDRHSTDQGE